MINKKINSKINQKGITMIYALLAILVMTVVGVIILNAASSNYGRFKNERSNQQAYLTVSSAAKVFSDSIVGDKVTFQIVNEKNGDKVTRTEVKNWSYVESDTAHRSPSEVTTSIRSFVQLYFESQYNGTLPPSIDRTSNNYEIRATITENSKSKELDRVFVNMRLEKYDIIAVFSNWDGESEKTGDIYYVTVRIPFINEAGNYDPIELPPETVIDENDPNHIIETTTHEVVWKQGNVSIVRGKE